MGKGLEEELDSFDGMDATHIEDLFRTSARLGRSVWNEWEWIGDDDNPIRERGGFAFNALAHGLGAGAQTGSASVETHLPFGHALNAYVNLPEFSGGQ